MPDWDLLGVPLQQSLLFGQYGEAQISMLGVTIARSSVFFSMRLAEVVVSHGEVDDLDRLARLDYQAFEGCISLLLLRAAKCERPDMVRYLMEIGAKITAPALSQK